jgi:uncharacterized protein (TIGR01777 family)
MKILLTGGTGFIGKPLRKELVADDHEVIILTRARKESSESLRFVQWDWNMPGNLTELVTGVDVVINLTGEPVINKRWSEKQKKILLKSRINPTHQIVSAINNSSIKPKKFISASAIGFYGNTRDKKITEDSPAGSDFLANLCKEWEEEALKAETNVTILRIGIVLGKKGGALERIVAPFKMFLGGPLGSGNQWMSWIGIHDLVGLIKFIIANENVKGIINATSPNPVTNKEFSNILGRVLSRPSFMPVPGIALKIMLGEMANVLLTGQRVYPEKASGYGYKFKYPDLEDALRRYLRESIRDKITASFN